MQIDTDLSPVISPKSNISTSFGSQRDAILFNLNSNKNNKFPMDNRFPIDNQGLESQGLKNDSMSNRQGSERYNANTNNQNNTFTTNESYSVDKYPYSENLNKENFQINSSTGLIIPENSTDRELQIEDDPSKSQIQAMHILEYEEFTTVDHPKLIMTNRTISDIVAGGKESDRVPPELFNVKLEQNIHSPEKQEDEEDFANKGELFGPEEINSNNNLIKFLKEVPREEMSFQDSVNNRKPELHLENLLQPMKESNGQDNIDSKIEPLENINNKGSKSNQFFIKGLSTLNGSQKKNEMNDIEISNDTFDAKNGLEDQKTKNENITPKNISSKEEHEIISKENSALKQELNEIYKDLKEIDLENLKLKEEVNHQREMLIKLQGKCEHVGNIQLGPNSEQEIKTKKSDNKLLLEENKALHEKIQKYKRAKKEKEEQINQLRGQYEELSRINQNELYISLIEKMKIYKDKIGQMSKEIEDQKGIIQTKDKTIENLLTQMDILTTSLANKNKEINSLKEANFMKSEISTTKENSELRSDPTGTISLYSRLRDQERIPAYSPEKLTETAEQHNPNSQPNSQPSSDRKPARTFANTQRVDANFQKAFFQPYINRKEKSVEDQLNKTNHWSTLKWNMLNQRDKNEKATSGKDQNLHKKSKNKSIDLYTKPKTDNKKNSQNIEELQKRLAYLKYKRMEFEKKKNTSNTKEELIESTRKTTCLDNRNSGFKTSLRGYDSLASPLKSTAGIKYTETLADQDLSQSKKDNFKTSYKSIHLTQESNIEEEMKSLRTSLTAKAKTQPKGEIYLLNPSRHAEEDFKLGFRYHSFSNTPAHLSKAAEATKKLQKKLRFELLYKV